LIEGKTIGYKRSIVMRRICWSLWFIALAAAAPPATTQTGQVRAKSLNEASGLVMSRRYAGVYWTHNDGDDGVPPGTL